MGNGLGLQFPNIENLFEDQTYGQLFEEFSFSVLIREVLLQQLKTTSNINRLRMKWNYSTIKKMLLLYYYTCNFTHIQFVCLVAQLNQRVFHKQQLIENCAIKPHLVKFVSYNSYIVVFSNISYLGMKNNIWRTAFHTSTAVVEVYHNPFTNHSLDVVFH